MAFGLRLARHSSGARHSRAVPALGFSCDIQGGWRVEGGIDGAQGAQLRNQSTMFIKNLCIRSRKMNVAEWQKRLEENFSVDGYVGGHLYKIIDLEKAFGEFYVGTFRGQLVLIDSFQNFYIETINKAKEFISTNGWPKDCPYYVFVLLYYIMNFRSFRACENLLLKGYPLDGYSLLRNLKDKAIFMGGIANNITAFYKKFI